MIERSQSRTLTRRAGSHGIACRFASGTRAPISRSATTAASRLGPAMRWTLSRSAQTGPARRRSAAAGSACSTRRRGSRSRRSAVPDGEYAGVGFSPDGDTLAVGARDPATRHDGIVLSAVPDLGRQVEPPVTTLSVDGDLEVHALSFSPDGRLIASVGRTGAQLWDADTELPLGLALGTSARALAFAPDGSVFAVGQDDGRVVVYPATVAGWEQAVCSMVGRNLSAAEWAQFVRGALPYQQTCPRYPSTPERVSRVIPPRGGTVVRNSSPRRCGSSSAQRPSRGRRTAGRPRGRCPRRRRRGSREPGRLDTRPRRSGRR